MQRCTWEHQQGSGHHHRMLSVRVESDLETVGGRELVLEIAALVLALVLALVPALVLAVVLALALVLELAAWVGQASEVWEMVAMVDRPAPACIVKHSSQPSRYSDPVPCQPPLARKTRCLCPRTSQSF